MTHRLPLEYLAESKTSSIQAERYMTTLIQVHGDDLETMEQRAAWLETRCTALGMTVRRCDYRNGKAAQP